MTEPWIWILLGWAAIVIIPLLRPGLPLNHHEDIDKDWP